MINNYLIVRNRTFRKIFINTVMGIGDWANPQSPIPNPLLSKSSQKLIKF